MDEQTAWRLGDNVQKKTVRSRDKRQPGVIIGLHANPILTDTQVVLVLWEDNSQSFERGYELKEDA